jgi:hypothetical protein
MGRQVKANFGELFKKILNEFGRIMERIGMRNEERVCLQCIMRFWCGNEVSFLQTSFSDVSHIERSTAPPFMHKYCNKIGFCKKKKK